MEPFTAELARQLAKRHHQIEDKLEEILDKIKAESKVGAFRTTIIFTEENIKEYIIESLQDLGYKTELKSGSVHLRIMWYEQ